jgi:hypothetical protein
MNKFIYDIEREGTAAGSGESTNKIMPSLNQNEMPNRPERSNDPGTQAEDATMTGDLDAGGGTGAQPNASLDNTDNSVMQEQKETD